MKQMILAGVIGAALMFIILKLMNKKDKKPSKTFDNFKDVAATPEAKALIKTDEFKSLIKTDQFVKFATDFGVEQLSEFVTV